jgi:hypothetical protein
LRIGIGDTTHHQKEGQSNEISNNPLRQLLVHAASFLKAGNRIMNRSAHYSKITVALCLLAYHSVPGSNACFGQITTVVPSTFVNMEGETSITNSTPVDYHSQQVYAASEFAALPPGENLLVRVDWRPDGGLMMPETYTADEWIMKFSTTSKNPGELDATYAANVGQDEVVVYSGTGTITTNNVGPQGGPKEIDYGIDLQVPFPYDPSKGNLLWDLTIIGGSQPLSLDWTLEGAGLTSTISTGANGSVESLIADYVQNAGGHIAQFTFIPEPSSQWLLWLAICSAAGLIRQRKAHVYGMPISRGST